MHEVEKPMAKEESGRTGMFGGFYKCLFSFVFFGVDYGKVQPHIKKIFNLVY